MTLHTREHREESPRAARDGLASILAEEEEKLLACVHCGFCLPACPTYVRLGDEADSPRGRLHLMRAVAEGRLEPDADAFVTHIDRCLGCRACETACPSGVEYGRLLEYARAEIDESGKTGWPTRALLRVFASAWATRLFMAGGRLLRMGGLARWLARMVPRRFARLRTGLSILAATKASKGLSLSDRSAGDRPPAPPVRDQPLPERRRAPEAAGLDDERPGTRPGAPRPTLRVALLDGCVQAGLFARVNRATRDVLEANDCEVIVVPGQGCCGALHAHGGALEDARRLARRNIDAFEAVDADYIVVNAAGCGATMKAYDELLAGDPSYAERARSFSSHVRDLFELLAELGPRPGAPIPMRITYDSPCHLEHAQHIVDAPLEVLGTVPDLEIVPLPGADECCGGAGIYGLLHPELGGEITGDKAESVRSVGVEAVVTPNPGCMMQIGAGLLAGGSEIVVLHPIEILAESYRRRFGPGRRDC